MVPFITIVLLISATSVADGFEVIGFNARALNNDSDYSPPAENLVRVYGTRFCPYTHRLLLILAAKNISCELTSIDTRNKPNWYKDTISSREITPCVQWNEKIVCGSHIGSEWLDDEFITNASRKLLPDDPYERAKQKMLFNFLEASKPAAHVYKAVYFRVSDYRTFGNYENEAAKYEESLTDRYLAGKEPGWVDYMLWPQLEKIELIPLVFKVLPPTEELPKFSVYLRRMRSRPEVQSLRRPARDHLRFLVGSVNEKPDFDVGLS